MKRKFNIIGHKKTFLSISGILILASIIAISVYGFNPGIDFVGGSLWQIRMENSETSVSDFENLFLNADIEYTYIYKDESSDGSFIIKMKSITEEQHQQYLSSIKEQLGNLEEMRFESIGPSVGMQLRNKAIEAALFVLLGISLFVAFAFRKVSYPVKSWKYGVIALATLFHDVIIPSGMLAVLGHFGGFEMSTNFIVALLVIMGFSVNDTIVVFDRIRENLMTKNGNTGFDEVVNNSVNQTIARSINTSFTLMLVLVAMVYIGAGSLSLFVLTMLVGVFVGTYSSVFIASPLLTIWQKFGKVK